MLRRMNAEASRPSTGEGFAVAGIFLSALLLRLLHLRQIRLHDPFFSLPSVDPRHYHEWALRIQAGDWLGDGVFFMAPLYPYTLGLLYSVAGPQLLAAHLLNCFLGAVTCVLVWGLAREFFDRRVSLLAAALTAFYSMLVFYGGSLLAENVITPLTLAVVWAAVRAFDAPRAGRWAIAGGLLGLAAIARQNVLLYAPLVLGWMFWSLRSEFSPQRRLVLAAAYVGAAALLILPVTIRNHAVTGDATWVATSGGSNFFSGNNAEAQGVYRIPSRFPRTLTDDARQQAAIYHAYAEQAEGRRLGPSEASAYWFGEGLAFIRENPGDWLALEARKFLRFWNAGEVWNNRSIELSRPFSWVLRLPLITFGVMAPFALLGIGGTARSWRELLPLHAMIAVYLVTALAFFVLSRYRVPVVPLLLIFAAVGVVQAVERVRARDWRGLAVPAAALVALAAFVHVPFGPPSLGMAHYNLGNRYRELQQWDLAIEQYRAALEVDPAYISTYNNLAITLEEMGGRRADAILTWEHVLALAQEQGLDGHAERARRHLDALGSPSATP
jgi:4-amino-4-deoxy-L-arabinose transferase-like glycosyltransferase